MRSAICCDCNALPDCARQQSAFSADCSRFGNAGQTTGFVPFGVDCPKSDKSRQWVYTQGRVIGITGLSEPSTFEFPERNWGWPKASPKHRAHQSSEPCD